MRQVNRDWWASYFDDKYLQEYEPIFSAAEDRRDIARLIEVLGLPLGSRILDVPCGQGRHARLLAEAGFDVVGLDYSRHLLELAKNDWDGVRYIRGDMRKMPAPWTGRFDAVVNLFTSFGFFLNPADDMKVVREFARVLKPDGVLVWHGASRDGVMSGFVAKDWWQSNDGTFIAHERTFDPLSGIMSVFVRQGDAERQYRIRLYTATRLAELFAAEGLVVEEAYDGWTERPLRRRTGSMTLVARKSSR
ncbi:MAG TPA: class I SAM-dependent methyltransferase [Gemmatimonadaceae bacterium]|nr:class I SAM-dependent methyltransferase [Gemmatimonadaceae bacterium]